MLEREEIDIHEKNIVRKHIDGRAGLLKLSRRAKHFISLLISDVPGDDPQDIASGYTVANTSTFEDARHVLRKKTKL